MAFLRVKAGVQPPMIKLIVAVANVAQRLEEQDEVWITSGIDGIHSSNSLHYSLRAIDIRTHNLKDPVGFVKLLRDELGPGYDVIYESAGKPNAHIHIEFDPS